MKKLVLMVALSACSSGASISGPGGFSPNSQVATPLGRLPDGGPDLSLMEVILAAIDQGPQGCAQLENGSGDAGQLTARILAFELGNLDGTPVGVGVYQVVPFSGSPDAGNQLAGVVLVNSDAGTLAMGMSGSVTLTAVSPNFVGEFNSVLQATDGGPWGTLSGSFNTSPVCAPPSN